MSVNENENLFSVNEGKSCNTDSTAGAKSEYSWQMSYDITVNKKNTSLFFCLFIISAQVFQRSYDIFMQTRTCSYKPRNMLQPMPGTDKMLQNLNLISCKSQMFSSPHDVCFSCAWDSSFGKNGDDQGLFVGWFELH